MNPSVTNVGQVSNLPSHPQDLSLVPVSATRLRVIERYLQGNFVLGPSTRRELLRIVIELDEARRLEEKRPLIGSADAFRIERERIRLAALAFAADATVENRQKLMALCGMEGN